MDDEIFYGYCVEIDFYFHDLMHKVANVYKSKKLTI